MVKRLLYVKFFSDADVEAVQHSVDWVGEKPVPLSERGRAGKMNSSHCLSCNESELLPVLEADKEAKDVYFKPTELLENNGNHIRTATVFGFQTPKKRLSMLAKAGSASKTGNSPRTPHTPHSALKSQPGTPQTPRMPDTPKTPSSATKGSLRTPKSKRVLAETSDAPTPYSFRKRVKQCITKMVCDEILFSDDNDSDFKNSSSESDSSDDNSTSEDELKENLIQTPSKTPKRMTHLGLRSKLSTPKTPSRTSRQAIKIKDVNLVATSEDYFIANGSSARMATSDHTLNHLKNPRLSADTLQMVLSEVGPTHPEEKSEMTQVQSSFFPRWMTLLCEGFNLFFYGLGSKKQLISTFQEEYLHDYDHIVVNGFFPSLSLKNILNSITEDILGNCSGFHGVQEQLEYIKNVYSKAATNPLFIIIHNLDGPMLRASKTQTVLAHLAALTRVHLLASFDHINAPLILDSIKMRYYNALWTDATTFSHYIEETSFENSLLLQQSGALTLSSLIHVFKSLTPNGKGIFLVLAKYQIDQKDNSSYAGMSFVDLRQRCWEKFLVNSDLSLRGQLTEFKDHKLIRFKKGPDGVENITVPLDAVKLKDFIEEQESSEM